MCGIAGGIHSGLEAKEAVQVLKKLAHRGPDDSGLWADHEIWLGNARLAIQDLSERGHQPMRTADGRYTLVFNGEIYNHQSLRPELLQCGAQFTSSCDTETLLYAYAAWGKECLTRLRGDFAFAVHDAEKKEVFIARDPIGVKPLYYYDDGRQMLFASELKALTGMPSLDYALAPEVFFQYLLFQYSPSADTPFRHIKKLLPGHCMCISYAEKDSARPRRYYTIPFTGRYEHHATAYWEQQLDKTLTRVVAEQLHADAPVGLTLSGGLDSSLLAALARKIHPSKELHAFTINTHGAMRSEGFGDDFSYAQLVAGQQRIRLHEVSGQLNIAQELDELIGHLDEPQADPAALHLAHISAAARNMGIKVLLSGTGGDDVFSGYRRHMAIPLLRMMAYAPRLAGSLGRILSGKFPANPMLRRAAKLAAGAGLSIDDAIIHAHFWAEPERISQLFQPGIIASRTDAMCYRLLDQLRDEIPHERSLLNKMLFYELRAFLPHHNLAYTDKLGMAHSVEIRVPFADTDIVALAATMPPAMKLRGQTTKFVLREVAKSYLPPAVIKRKKTGFGAPLRTWMKNDLLSLARERLSDESFFRYGIFSRHAIETLIEDNRAGRIDGAYTLFSLLSIESWLRQFAPSA